MIFFRNTAVVEFELVCPVGANAHLFFLAAEFKSGRAFFDDETRDAARAAGRIGGEKERINLSGLPIGTKTFRPI